MGRRRVRDLLALGHEVVGFDVRADRCAAATEGFAIPIAASAEALLAGGGCCPPAAGAGKADSLQALVISTPPDHHVEYYERALRAGLPFFSEANVLTPSPSWFEQRATDPDVLGHPSATMRFDPQVLALRERLATLGVEGVRSVHYAGGDYLPRWHPYERYDEFYAGAARGTGGVRESVPFELDWLCWLLGPVAAVQALHRARARWRTDIDDTYLLLLEFESGAVGSIMVELHQQAPFKLVRIAHCRQSFTLDMLAGVMSTHRLGLHDQALSELFGPQRVDRQQVYLSEIRAFTEAVTAGRPYPKSWAEDRHHSDVLCAAERSEQIGARVRVADVAGAYEGTDLASVPPPLTPAPAPPSQPAPVRGR
jgi:predicted dehydrogenase